MSEFEREAFEKWFESEICKDGETVSLMQKADMWIGWMSRGEVEPVDSAPIVWIDPENIKRTMIASPGETVEVSAYREGEFIAPLYTHPPAPTQGVPESIIKQCEVAIEYAAEIRGGCISGVREAQKRVRSILSAPNHPSGEWVRCDERLPHISDGDERCSLWVSGLYENTGNRFVMMAFVGEAIDLAQKGAIDHFMPTGLTRPQPPKDQAQESCGDE